jgi:acyl carrier protein
MANDDALVQGVRQIIAGVLAVDLDEAKPAARFFEDLGAESIDMLELTFQIEKQFGVKDPFAAFGRAEDLTTDSAGRLTSHAVGAIRERFPFLDVSRLEVDPRKDRLTELLTVEAITRFVRQAVGGARPAA